MFDVIFTGVKILGMSLALMIIVALCICVVLGVIFLLYCFADWRGQWLDNHPEEPKKEKRR